jgi:hypothetical protein
VDELPASILFYGRWVAAGLLALFGLAAIVGNWSIVVYYLRPRNHSTSMVPIVGGLSVGAAMLIVPIHSLHIWAWVPPVVDIGCGLMVVGALVDAIRRRNRPGPG